MTHQAVTLEAAGQLDLSDKRQVLRPGRWRAVSILQHRR